jgi:hypothetical protein
MARGTFVAIGVEKDKGTFRLSYFKNIYLPYCISTSDQKN